MTERTPRGLFCGDYREFLPRADSCWVVTDPPYNVGFSYPEYRDSLSDADYRALFDPLRGYRAVVINYPREMIESVIPALGYPARTVAWCYNSNLARQWRMVAWFNCSPDLSKVKQPYKNLNDSRIMSLLDAGRDGCDLYDWWQIELVKNTSREKRGYTNQIPEEVIRRILLTTVPDGDLIFDPFCGSGTTPAVARRLGYQSLATDISAIAIEIAAERLGELTLFGARP